MEQAVRDERPLKPLVSSAQWRELAVFSNSEVIVHVPPLGHKVVETVSKPQHGMKELSAERLATITDHGQSRCRLQCL